MLGDVARDPRSLFIRHATKLYVEDRDGGGPVDTESSRQSGDCVLARFGVVNYVEDLVWSALVKRNGPKDVELFGLTIARRGIAHLHTIE